MWITEVLLYYIVFVVVVVVVVVVFSILAPKSRTIDTSAFDDKLRQLKQMGFSEVSERMGFFIGSSQISQIVWEQFEIGGEKEGEKMVLFQERGRNIWRKAVRLDLAFKNWSSCYLFFSSLQ